MSDSGAAPTSDGAPPADAARRLVVETSTDGTAPAHPVDGAAAGTVGAPAAGRRAGPVGPTCAGRGRAGVPLRTSVALGVLAVVVGSTALALGMPSRDPFLAAGDRATGTYLAVRADGDQAAAAVLAGPYQERPGPPVPARGAGGAADPLSASRPLVAAPAAPSPAIGALFSPGDDDAPAHYCTASVVHSPDRDLVVTAAHCVHDDGFRTRLVFAPGLHDGIAPYGLWVPTRIHVDPRWISDRDPDRDVAFLRVRRYGRADSRIEDLTGAERIRFDAPAGRPALLTGYPADQDRPISCRHTAEAQGPTQLRFRCPGFPNGTSGGPMLTDLERDSGTGSLIGVIGGLDEGGDDLTSYSSRFGGAVAALYRRATADPPPTPGVRPRVAPRS
ncbi:trypsin-like peptidase domain-containing protein [Streptomyces sp. NPDC048506]|uniref:trypsin-like serine peptidase n=1 Tax=Streptomyces sp. NPDC048506 TaxID=3155028 RepID=UPI00341FF8AA